MGAVSDGERRAASGLRNQYGVGASLIIEALRQHDFEWTRIADPEAGRVDDIQIARTARLDAYQVKWQQYPGTFTFNNLIKSTKKSPSLISQLVDGWNRLKTQHPNRRITVHLVTDAFASPSTGILPKTNVPPSPYHFAAFIEQAWKPAKQNKEIDFRGDWSAVWREIQTASGLEKEAFSLFAWDCSLDFRTPSPSEDEDCQSLSNFLFETAASGEHKIEFSRAELLNRLGWQNRYDYRNPHEFDVPLFYQPINSTVNALKERFTAHDRGYICLIGSPGSGKSTLLTRTLRELSVRLVRYYAYVPEAQDPTVLRGESVNFLHDITLRLEESGFGQRSLRPSVTDRSALLKRLHEQLQSLGSDFEATGQKTIILVDGLDHISREQKPERSLLSDLPLPNQIPRGVYIVLGSQTADIDTFPPLVRREIDLEEHRIEIGRLSPSDVSAITIDVLPELEAKERYQLFELSAGHPLALSYLINQLEPVDDAEERAAILAEAITYADDIDAYYYSHWSQIQDDDELIHILGLLSRVRGAIAMKWAAGWIERSAVRKIDRLFKPYFTIDAVNRWSFFHNSFRLFLQNRTCQPVLGRDPDETSDSFHLELAELYNSSDIPWRWEALYHLYRANNYSNIVSLSTTDWFQSQVKSLRPLRAIQTDVRLAIRSAGKIQDPLSLVRLTLVLSSLDQRQYTLNDYAFADLFLDLKDVYLALEFIRDGDSLKVGKEEALNLSVRLAAMGLLQEGERLFELAEPYDLLAGNHDAYRSSTSIKTPYELLGAWARAAVRFRKTNNVIRVIENTEVHPDPRFRREPEQVTAYAQQEMITHAAIGCAEQQTWDKWKEYMNWLASKEDGCVFTALLRSVEIASKVDQKRSQELFQKLLEYFDPSMLKSDSLEHIKNHIAVAELALLHEDRESVTAWIGHLPDLPLQNDSYGERGLRQEVRFRLYRLKYWLRECG
ncbi:MAG: ATP-binding protein, partial [Cyanobacteria bacterium J06649_4]